MRAMIITVVAVSISVSAEAQESPFHAGPLIPDYGHIATIENRDAIPKKARFRIAYDVTKQAEAGTLNRAFVTPARFLNMHAEAGVDPKRMSLAVVIHGGAVKDLLNAERYAEEVGGENVNAPLIAELREHGVEFIVCGQSAAYQGIVTEDLLPGVRMSLSAMTAHALLQQDGYTLNPF